MKNQKKPAAALGNKNPAGSRLNMIILTITVFSSFLIFGFSENVKGPAVSPIQGEFGVSELQIGILFACNSLGRLAACGYTAALVRKIGVKCALILSLVVMAASGVFIWLAPTFALLTAGFFVLYLGHGMVEIVLGIMAARVFTRNTGTMMNLSHFFYGLSSALAPLLSVGLMSARLGEQALGWRGMYLAVLLFSLVPIIPALFGRLKNGKQENHRDGVKAFFKNPNTKYIVALLSLAVTGEMAVGGWLVIFVEKSYALTAQESALVLTAFFVCFTLARLLLGPVIDKIGFIKSLLIASGFSGAAILIGVMLGRPGIFLLIAAGFGIAPIYPTVMAVLAKLFAGNIDSAMTATLTIMSVVVVAGSALVGGVVDGAKGLYALLGAGDPMRLGYAAGYLFIGLCFAAAFFVAVRLYKKLGAAQELI